ncbi:caspase domain-containing protein [uncultured Robinsoniella sp.]|uniref:caspase family protein n=1 Tax=uncultured Robinsoniella sp. TaxID=904190 RepID=UPI00374F5736
MGKITALLVGVCEYLTGHSLPKCKNDIYVLKEALVHGINVNPENIFLCGKDGTVTLKELVSSIERALFNLTNDDTFIFYFSGHGGKNCLMLSDGIIELQNLIDTIGSITTKNKIVILDSCHSGGFDLNDIAKIDINETTDQFAGRGYAVLASCGADEYSGFDNDRQISKYTSFLCDALTSSYLIRQGKKSLEEINEAIFRFAEVSNLKAKNSTSIIQKPIFRSSIGGTIFFDVEEYTPYKVNNIYEESDTYIIYEVKPLHHGGAKRLSVNVILRFKSSLEQIAKISKEIKNKVLHYEVHQNEISEYSYAGKPANIVWCSFGYDEDDMIDCNFVCQTTWVDDLQDKENWYHSSNNDITVEGVHVTLNGSYELIKSLRDSTLNKNELICITREYTANIISAAERYIKMFREYLNSTLTEDQFINSVSSLNIEISKWFFKQSELPIPPNELHDWAHIHTRLACTIHDFTLFYDRKNINTWKSDNRKWLLTNAIKQYELELEELKLADQLIRV